MLVGQQRNMRQRLILNDFALCSEAFDDFVNLDGVPVEDRIRDQTEAGRLIHDLLVVTSGELALVSKENAPRQLILNNSRDISQG